jgi:hypothetical protein
MQSISKKAKEGPIRHLSNAQHKENAISKEFGLN